VTAVHDTTCLPTAVDASAALVIAPRLPVVPDQRRPALELDLEVVIPAFNEAERLPRTISLTAEYLAAQPWRSQIVVVDNGSSDRTAHTARALATADVPVQVVGCARPGKGAAVRRGLLRTDARHVGFVDADLATPIETLGPVMEHLRAGAAAVIASRYVAGATLVRRQPLLRRAGGAVFRQLTQPMVAGIRDTQCGFKFFQRAAVAAALVQCHTTGFAFDVELLSRIQAAGGSIVEVPVAWTDVPASTFRPLRDGAASFAALLALKRG
jgi:dolichyl-phosphate beta-glucosyltransferase